MTAGFWSAPTHGLRRWYAVLAGIAWWMAHLVAEASLARVSCQHPSLRWAMNAITLVTAAGTVLALVWCAQMVAGSRALEPAPAGGPAHDAQEGSDLLTRERFLGLFGLAVGAISLLLILWEGSYVVALSSCASY